MRKNLPNVPLQVSLGRIPAALADEIASAGDGLSLKGRALLLLSADGLEKVLSELDINPDMAALIVRTARLLEAQKAAKAAGERA